jgi:hypothetical protein
VVLALLILGTSMVLAGQALQSPADGPPGSTPRPGSTSQPGTTPAVGAMPVPSAPALNPPEQALVTSASIDVTGTLPGGLPRDGSHRLRIYINGDLVRERRLPRRDAFRVDSVPLRQGENAVQAAIVGPGGESLHSAPVAVSRDDVAPVIRLMEPRDGATIHSDTQLLRGRSEAGAALEISNRATSQTWEVIADADGRFEVALSLALGRNRIAVHARDEAGNRSRASIDVVREEGVAAVDLSLSRDTLAMDALPTALNLTARITDELGAAVDGAEVTFSISPPGQSTTTYRTTSSNGVAVWRAVRVPREGTASGPGFATVLVALPSGRTLQGSARFTIRAAASD